MVARDFGGLRGLIDEARALDEENENRPLVDCQKCGTPLQRRSDGLGNCPMGHFTTWAQTQGEVDRY